LDDVTLNLAELASNILDHACPNGGDNNTYYIETHCVAWTVAAEKTPDGWIIHNVSSEDC